MNRKRSKYIFIFMCCLTVIVLFGIFSLTASAESDYTITEYNINMVVNEDNTFDITENITVDFNGDNHGIYRKLPIRNTVTRTDGSVSKNRAIISNVDVSESFKTYRNNGYYVIKIGEDDTTVTGSHLYTISYTYDIGKDPLKDSDELYFNLIGTEWDAYISNISFHITMPKEFDESLLGFSSGSIGTFGSDSVVYSVNGNEISGYLEDCTLSPYNALTVRLTLPEGYFVGTSSGVNKSTAAVMLFCGICFIISAVIWLMFGNKGKLSSNKPEHFPPKGWNSAEVGVCYYGEARTEGIASLVVYLASKGYLKIQQVTERHYMLWTKKKTVLVKLREYNGNNVCERMFLDGIFKSGSAVTLDSLRDDFYLTFDKVKAKLNSQEVKRLMYEPSSTNKTSFLSAMLIAVYAAITALPMIEYGAWIMLIPAFLFPGLSLYYIIRMVMGKLNVSRIVGWIYLGLMGLLTWLATVFPCLRDDSEYTFMYILGAVCMAFMIIFIIRMPKRTKFGNEMYWKIKNFRKFLISAEKSRLEMFAACNPEYFYDIMPFAYALGVSDKWIKQFKVLGLRRPVWYDDEEDDDIGDTDGFFSFMDDMMNSAQAVMSSSSSSSDSGSSDGGGGSSGGGSGGGGGGSW